MTSSHTNMRFVLNYDYKFFISTGLQFCKEKLDHQEDHRLYQDHLFPTNYWQDPLAFVGLALFIFEQIVLFKGLQNLLDIVWKCVNMTTIWSSLSHKNKNTTNCTLPLQPKNLKIKPPATQSLRKLASRLHTTQATHNRARSAIVL